jgi:hypothetical protein
MAHNVVANEDEKRIVGNMVSDACALPEPERDVSLTARLCRSRDDLDGRIEEPTWIEPCRVVNHRTSDHGGIAKDPQGKSSLSG